MYPSGSGRRYYRPRNQYQGMCDDDYMGYNSVLLNAWMRGPSWERDLENDGTMGFNFAYEGGWEGQPGQHWNDQARSGFMGLNRANSRGQKRDGSWAAYWFW